MVEGDGTKVGTGTACMNEVIVVEVSSLVGKHCYLLKESHEHILSLYQGSM